MKISIQREIDVPNSLTCKKCSALSEYELDSPLEETDYKTADCRNFNTEVFATANSNWDFVKCRKCVDASLEYLRRLK